MLTIKRKIQQWSGKMRRITRRLGPTGPLAVAATVLPGIGGFVIYGSVGHISHWTKSHEHAGPWTCAAAFSLLGGLALVPTYAMSAICGWSFGFSVGLAATLGGFLGAAMLAGAWARRADAGRTIQIVSESPRWQAIHRAMLQGRFVKTALVIALVRLAPFAPFSLTNLVLSSMNAPRTAYAAGTVLGMAPRTAMIVFTASRLPSFDITPAKNPWMTAAVVVATLLACGVLGVIGRRALAHVTETSQPDSMLANPGL